MPCAMPLHQLADGRVGLQQPGAVPDEPGQPGPQLGVRVGGRGEDGVLRVGPQRAGPGADGGVLEQLLLELLDPGRGVRVGAQGVHVGAQPARRRQRRSSCRGSAPTSSRKPLQAGEDPVEHPVVDPVGHPGGGGVAQLGAEDQPVLLQEARPARAAPADRTSWCRSPSTTSSSTRATAGAAGVSCSLRSTRAATAGWRSSSREQLATAR